MDPLYGAARAILFRLDAERAHDLVLRSMALAARSRALTALARWIYCPPPHPGLGQELFGIRFPSPVGLAAGLDKNGVAIDLWAALGFGFVEVGTVTPGQGQPGNDKPRLARLKADRALVNRMGFNNRGVDALVERLKVRRSTIPVGANLGKAKITPNERAAEDYLYGLRAVWAHVDYITINISSPNTPGLRDLQAVDALAPLLEAIVSEGRALAAAGGKKRPILLKISPDLADDDLDRAADVAKATGVDGIIATNTTLRREGLLERPPIEGGISGAPLKARAAECAARLSRRVGDALPIVGVGGIESGQDAYDRLRAGASLVQVYSALIYSGPSIVGQIAESLFALLQRDGYSRVGEVSGASLRRSLALDSACSSTPPSGS
ncbi:MAG: quinone-dependent dihydroorotate dehydrogenase [Myxococcota bacterium]